MKYCKDCVHFAPSGDTEWCGAACVVTEDMVWGKKKSYRECRIERESGECGKEARNYAEKKL